MQPLLALAAPATPIAVALRVGLACSGVLELAGASLALWMLAWMLRSDPPGRTRTGLRPVLPFFASAFIALCVGLRSHTSLQVRALRKAEALSSCSTA